MSLKEVIERSDTRAGRVFDLLIQALIVGSLISFSVETLPGLSADTRRILGGVEIVFVAVFTAEYVARIIVADSKPRFILSFFGLVDLAAILPFYLATGLDLRSVRAIRLLRLFRIFKILRYSQAIQRFHRAFLLAREEIILFLVAAGILIYLAAVGIYYCERDAQPESFASVFHGVWWAMATLTTVGYGDVIPVTFGGRAFTCIVVVLGLGIVAVPTGLFASALSKAREIDSEHQG